MAKDYGRATFWATIFGIAILVVITALVAHGTARWIWLIILFVGLFGAAVSLYMMLKPAKGAETKEIGLGQYVIDTRRVKVTLHEGTGASVWPAKWWAPWRPDAIHVERLPTLSNHDT